MGNTAIKSIKPLGFTWQTMDPFLFCVHHLDHFPAGNAQLGPEASLAGRNIGQDFTVKDGWRMYHGQQVPGFPAHPHRGFETVTIVLKGYVDHSDSHGAAGRYGQGDVQWMTAGAGLQHAEMFPLIKPNGSNTLELFQIWLNLPKAKKFAKPHYKMLWAEDIAQHNHTDTNGLTTEVTVIAGLLEGVQAPGPAPDSWAASAESDVAIWLIRIPANGQWALPPANKATNRALYFYRGDTLTVDGTVLKAYHAAELQANQLVDLQNGTADAFCLLLQGRPINEPVVQHGPFVMNSREEISQAIADYNRTQFGGWPWSSTEPVQNRQQGRFASYADGTEEHRD